MSIQNTPTKPIECARETKSLHAHYRDKVVSALQKHFGYQSVMQAPKLQKITLNMGIGEAVNDKKALDAAFEQMSLIAGQKPIVTYARKSIAGFKIREGYPIGCKVTLRGHQMWHFLNRLVHVAVPRIRDFHGFSPRSFDGRGNFTFGIKEQIVFAEIDFDKVDKIRGMDIIFTTSAPTDAEGLALLRAMGLPFANK